MHSDDSTLTPHPLHRPLSPRFLPTVQKPRLFPQAVAQHQPRREGPHLPLPREGPEGSLPRTPRTPRPFTLPCGSALAVAVALPVSHPNPPRRTPRPLPLRPQKRITAEQALQHEWVRDGAPDAPIDTEVLARMRVFAGMEKLKRLSLMARLLHAPAPALRSAAPRIPPDARRSALLLPPEPTPAKRPADTSDGSPAHPRNDSSS